jgi:FAD/FMN-containing dehydrogenase
MNAIINQTPSLSVSEADFQKFTNQLRGSLILPDSSSYETERKVYSGMIDKYPACIVKCHDVADVIACVNFCRQNKITVAIRSGGHNAGGLGVADGALVIDLARMNGVRVDLKTNSVRVEGGCLLGDLDHATQPFGKAVPTGILSTTGIAGLMLGGGLGHLSRAYGLTIDSLIEADIVLADGSLVTASSSENADLFWAIRGGGGNFGVITSFLFRLSDVGTVYGGPMLWHIKDSEEMMQFYRDFILKAPNEIYCYFAFLTVPPVALFPEELHLKKMCGLVWCNVGSETNAKKAADTFRNFKKPALDYTGPIPFSALQAMFDALYPKGLNWYWKADFVKDLSDEAISINVRFGNLLPTPHSTTHLYPINGKCQKVKKDETAFFHRDANWAQVIVGVDPDAANNDKISSWARDYWQAVHPHSSGGAYINFMMEEGDDRISASYGTNYEKLRKVKGKYDPLNLFHINQNIKPAV